ncbi:MAG: thiamine phosphate synthase [Prevotella sp.]|jgi:thiamine-phosphate pyrophosphorylase|nr:thiamine phosphate synthase [Prevotella sp.]
MIQYISNSNAKYSHLQGIRLALAGGCRWIQLRMKDCADDEIIPVAKQVKELCREYGAKFVIDDNVEIAKLLDLDGVHLGKNDMPVAEARILLGENKIIGGTANTFEDVERIYRDGADYIGCGPFRFTTTKKRLAPILGLEGYRSITSRMKSAGIDIPMVAIGGIKAGDIKDIMQTGVDGIALSGSVLNAENPVEEMKRIIKICENEKQY